MQEEFLKANEELKKFKIQAYEEWLLNIQECFKEFQTSGTKRNVFRLVNTLRRCKYLKAIRKRDLSEILRYCLEHCKVDIIQGEEWYYLIKVLRPTQIKGYSKNWEAVYKQLAQSVPVVYGYQVKYINEIILHMRPSFDSDNAPAVARKFTRNMIQIQKMQNFININKHTKDATLLEFLSIIQQQQQLYNAAELDVFILKIARKIPHLFPFQRLTIHVFKKLFSVDMCPLIANFIGTKNNHSQFIIEFLPKRVFFAVQPFKKMPNSLKYFFIFAKQIFNRIKQQKSIEKKINQLLKQKQEKIQKTADKSFEEQQQNNQTNLNMSSEDEQETNFQENNKEEESSQDQEEQFDIKIQRYKKKITNYITSEHIALLIKSIQPFFQRLFFVLSHTALQKFLTQIYQLAPHLVVRSLDLLIKIQSAPHLFQEKFLAARILPIALHIISCDNFPSLLQRLLNIILFRPRLCFFSKIIQTIAIRIPLLQEQDCKKCSDTDKQLFLKRFQMEHDRFYEQYSETMYQIFSRLLQEGQHVEDKKLNKLSTQISIIINCSYPFFKKRIWKIIGTQINDNLNELLISIMRKVNEIPSFIIDLIQQKRESLKGESEEAYQMSQGLASIVYVHSQQPFDSFKKEVRMWLAKGRTSLINHYAKVSTLLQIFSPLMPSSLSYRYENVPLIFKQYPSTEKRLNRVNLLMQYVVELIDQLYSKVDEIPCNLQNKDIITIIQQLYAKDEEEEQNFSIRKEIREILILISKISKYLVHQIVTYNEGKYQFIKINRPSLIQNEKFIHSIKKLCRNKSILKDGRIVTQLSKVFDRNTLCTYTSFFIKEKQIIKSINKLFPNRQEQTDPYAHIQRETAEAKFLSLFRQNQIYCNKLVVVQKFKNQMYLMLLGHQSKNIESIFSIFHRCSQSFICQFGIFLSQLFGLVTIQSRFYWSKLNILLSNYYKIGGQLSNNFQKIINGIVILTQHKSNVLRIEGLNAVSTVLRNQNIDLKIISNFKMTNSQSNAQTLLCLLWLIKSLYLPKQDFKQYKKYIVFLQPLLFSQNRTFRTVALNVYSECLIKIKQAYSVITEHQITTPYQQKSLTQFFDNGFLRPEHVNKINLQHRQALKNNCEYFKYRTEQIVNQFQNVHKALFSFILGDNALKFIRLFHADRLSSVAEATKMSIKIDFEDIAEKMILKMRTKINVYTLFNGRVQSKQANNVFFKYLFAADIKYYKLEFFHKTKDYVEGCLSNLQLLDNQECIYNYTEGLLQGLDKWSNEQFPQTQTFLVNIVQGVMVKASKQYFQHFCCILKSLIRPSLCLIKLAQKYIATHSKISRASELIINLHQNSYSACMRILQSVLPSNIDLSPKLIALVLQYIFFPIQKSNYIYETETIIKTKQFAIGNIKIAVMDDFISLICKELQKNINQGRLKIAFDIACKVLSTLISKIFFQRKQYFEFGLQLIQFCFKVFQMKEETLLQIQPLTSAIQKALSHSEIFFSLVSFLCKRIHLLPKKLRLFIIQRVLLFLKDNFSQEQTQAYNLLIESICLEQLTGLSYQILLKSLSQALSRYGTPKDLALRLTKPQKVLLAQAEMLAKRTIKNAKIAFECPKQRRSVWCKLMLTIRPRAQLIQEETEEEKEVWRQIRQLSNPYNYIS